MISKSLRYISLVVIAGNIVGTFIAIPAAAQMSMAHAMPHVVAHTSAGGSTDASDSLLSYRFTVRPHAMVLGARNPTAGEYPLDSLPGYIVHVSPQCAGAHRCPLVVFLPWGGARASDVLGLLGPVADHYGMIVLAPGDTGGDAGRVGDWYQEATDRAQINDAMKQVLSKFAVDPDKIALAGHCRSGWAPVIWGTANRDIFSRLLVISTAEETKTFDALGPSDGRIEFLLEDGFGQTDWMYRRAHLLREHGYPVKHVVSIRAHSSQPESIDFVGHWLQESWAIPDPTQRITPPVIDAIPTLTDSIVAKMTTFWRAFQQLPDSIWTVARQAHQRELRLPIGADSPSTVMVDMSTMAKQYSAVAAALASVGLTADQHDRYRVALLEALIGREYSSIAQTFPTGSVQADNVAFVREHHDEIRKLDAQTKIWAAP